MVTTELLCTSYNSRECISPPPSHGCEQPGREVPGRIDGVATVEAKGASNSPEEETDHERLETSLHLRVLGVTDGKDPQHQQESAKNLYM